MTDVTTPEGPAIDMQEILKRIPHRYPFLLIDRAEDYHAHKSIVGIKCVTMNEHFFQGHFPEQSSDAGRADRGGPRVRQAQS